jgi:hypothetical protein
VDSSFGRPKVERSQLEIRDLRDRPAILTICITIFRNRIETRLRESRDFLQVAISCKSRLRGKYGVCVLGTRARARPRFITVSASDAQPVLTANIVALVPNVTS